MIIANYTAFRKYFALPGATIMIDGLPEWPAAMVNANGFDQGIGVSINELSQYVATFDATDGDDTPNVEEYDWFCSVRTETEAGKPLIFSPVSNKSGSLTMALSAWAAAAYPSPFASSTIPALFGGCFLYVRRRADGAIQTLDLRKHVEENLAVPD